MPVPLGIHNGLSLPLEETRRKSQDQIVLSENNSQTMERTVSGYATAYFFPLDLSLPSSSLSDPAMLLSEAEKLLPLGVRTFYCFMDNGLASNGDDAIPRPAQACFRAQQLPVDGGTRKSWTVCLRPESSVIQVDCKTCYIANAASVEEGTLRVSSHAMFFQFEAKEALEVFITSAAVSPKKESLNVSKTCVEKKVLYPSSHLNNTDAGTAETYFQYYGKLSNQMNMLQDSVRTKHYRDAIVSNAMLFENARVMDVGGGSGILSFFATQAGAARVYTVEASSIADVIPTLAATTATAASDRLKVVKKTVETVSLEKDLEGQKVDALISEPIGTFLFNERMIESYLFARDAFLKPGGALFPDRCCLYLAPFSDAAVYNDFMSRAAFWTNDNFHGVDLRPAYERALEEQFRQPVVDYIDPYCLVGTLWHQETFDLATVPREFLKNMEFTFRFPITTPCVIHGLASWFDILFEAGPQKVGFSTAPWCPPTHWYQIRFLFRRPLALNENQTLIGTLRMVANKHQSYYVTIMASIEGTSITTSSAVIDLKDPEYRYFSNPQASYVPPSQSVGTSATSTQQQPRLG